MHAPVDLALMEVLVPTMETQLYANVLKDSLEASVNKVTEFVIYDAHLLNLETTLYTVINNTTGKNYSVAFI